MLNYKTLLEPGETIDELIQKVYEYAMKENMLPEDTPASVLKDTFHSWMASRPWVLPQGLLLGSIKPSLGLEDDQPKAYWKSFPDRQSFYKQLIYDSHPRLKKNQQREVRLAIRVLKNEKIRNNLNTLRRALAQELWRQESIWGKMSYYLTTNPIANLIPNMGGSYNLANSYPKLRGEPDLDDIESLQPILNMMFIKTDRISLAFSEENFSVSENIAILHDIKELFSPRGNSRVLPTAHPQLIPNPYKGKNSPKEAMRWEVTDGDRPYKRVPISEKEIRSRSGVFKGFKFDQGRLGAGTRDENSADTQNARKKYLPLETGRSHTAARLFEMVSLLKPAMSTSQKNKKIYDEWMRAIAYGIFAYWNAPNHEGGYPKSLTPIHTYHEVMDPAEDYLPGIYRRAFSYRDLQEYLE
ncbi:hypothetical protein [Chryseobacterium sp. CT-SW4]|uniref:hypothetical protein n=1 Tax=Chryseobacterium sp. SW-1 TaxID=3157343 RepID=UPI003B024311